MASTKAAPTPAPGVGQLQLWYEYQIGVRLLIDQIRGGAARELYTHDLADRVIKQVQELEQTLLHEATP